MTGTKRITTRKRTTRSKREFPAPYLMSKSFNQHNRCPNCNGFAGAYKSEKRCRGFRHRDGEGFFCEVLVPGERVYNFAGYDLNYYSYKEEEA